MPIPVHPRRSITRRVISQEKDPSDALRPPPVAGGRSARRAPEGRILGRNKGALSPSERRALREKGLRALDPALARHYARALLALPEGEEHPALVALVALTVRRERGWSVAELAHALHVTRRTVQRWEAHGLLPRLGPSLRRRVRRLAWIYETRRPPMPQHVNRPATDSLRERLHYRARLALEAGELPETPDGWARFAARVLDQHGSSVGLRIDSSAAGVRRRAALALVMRQYDHTLEEIGRAIGRHHSTAAYLLETYGEGGAR